MAAPEILLPTVKQVNINGTVYDIKSRYWGSMDSNNPAASFKKINGQSVYGSGNIPCSYPKQSRDNSSNTFELLPNIFYVWGTITTSSLNIKLGGITSENTNFANEYIFQFTTGSTTPTLSITSGTTLKWANGVAPTNLLINTTYQISIMNGCGIIIPFM